MARHVYEDALRQAGAKFNSRAAARGSGARKQAVQTAVANREPLRPFMAAVGVKEDELLRHVFDTFRAQAIAEFDIYRAQVAAVVGDRAPVPSPADVAHAVDYLVAGLTTMVRARLLDGEQATLAAAAPKMLPKRGRTPDGGFDLPHGLPDPDELSQAAMRLVRNAINVTEGRSDWIPGATPDRMPELAVVDDAPPMPEEALADEAGVLPLWTWVHGFYGEPMTEFDGHINLDGFQTYERSSADEPGDPDLASQSDWPGYDWYFPADHDSCTCEWVVEDATVPDQPVERTRAPAERAPRIQSTRDVLEQARQRVQGPHAPEVDSGRLTAKLEHSLNHELDEQGLDADHPVRGVISDHWRGDQLAVARDSEGNITGAIAYDLKRSLGTSLDDFRVLDEGKGTGTKLMQHVAIESLAAGNDTMTVYSAVQRAVPFYQRMGAEFRAQRVSAAADARLQWSGLGHWDETAVRALAEGNPLDKRKTLEAAFRAQQ